MIDYAYACWIRRLAEDTRSRRLFLEAEELFSELRMQAAAQRCQERALEAFAEGAGSTPRIEKTPSNFNLFDTT